MNYPGNAEKFHYLVNCFLFCIADYFNKDLYIVHIMVSNIIFVSLIFVSLKPKHNLLYSIVFHRVKLFKLFLVLKKCLENAGVAWQRLRKSG